MARAHGHARAPAAGPGTLLARAQQLLAEGELDGGLALAGQALQADPDCGPAHLLLAMASVLHGRAEAALRHAVRAVALCPGDARALFALGRAHKLANELGPAIQAYRSALALQPDYAEVHVSLGIALKNGGDLDAAMRCYERAVALKPGLAAARANLAYVRAAWAERALEAGTAAAVDESAVDEARQATLLDPGNAQLHFNLGLLLRHARRRDEAIDAFNRALGAEPLRLEYCLRLGHELTAAGAPDAAIALYERWQQGQPPVPVVMRALASLLAREGQASAAVAWAEKAAAMEPDPRAWLQLCHSYQQCRRLADALAAGRKAVEMSGRRWAMYPVPLMVANYLLEDPVELAAWHAEAGAALPAVAAPALPRRPRAVGERLRIGYVSADFISHSVASFIAPLLAHHDCSRFEVWCYHNRGWADATTAQLRALVPHWVECEHLSDDALLQRVRADGIDILVDLSGHTAGARLQVFARGAAPLQLGYLGYPTVTGVPGMHHRLSDSVIDPGDQPDIGSDRPLCLSRSMFCYRPPEDAPAIRPEPASRHGPLTLASFNNLAKLGDRTLALWAQVLRALPGSRLLLKAGAAGDPANQHSVRAFMAAHGVAPERLDMRARVGDRRAHLALYNEVDIALDSHPYNGATTTCEALWMGVPVLSLAGRTHPSRMGASLLSAAGQGGWVCRNDEEFVARAVALAADDAGRARWRGQARDLLRHSALMDERGFVAEVEQLLWTAWHAPSPPGIA